ncbi:MAG TPA: TatD family hydrolase [Ilumatobacteraceae bacterium]|nr:TatD family hydrolase [Ilumatobacteraceae bacterium]
MNPAAARAGHIDVHAHLDKYVDEDLDLVIDEIERDGIATIAVSVDPESHERTRTIARQCSLIVPSFGIHPWQAPRYRDALDTIQHHGSSSPMIGEIGLGHRFVDRGTTPAPLRRLVAENLARLVGGDLRLAPWSSIVASLDHSSGSDLR